MKKMMPWLLVLFVPVAVHADICNVALNADVTLNGEFKSDAELAKTVVDGDFLNRATSWQNGTVYWYGTSSSITIDLDGTYAITSFVVQADDNDAYLLEYWDLETETWKTAWDVSNYDKYGYGMQTRPDPTEDSVQWILSSAITTNALRFTAVSGDGKYSVSEIQAYGTVVPVPGAATLGLLGLGCVCRRMRRRRQS